jgi:hypothetical protein
MELLRRKIALLSFLLAFYTGVSFWVCYSKLWFIKDVMHNQARLFFATQSMDYVKNILIDKAEALDIPINPEDVKVQNINGEIIYIELRYDVPLDILFYHSTLHFEPKIFGLIKGFDMTERKNAFTTDSYESLTMLSDSTKNFLREKHLLDYLKDFFAK